MAPFIFLGVGALVAYNIFRYFGQEWTRVNEALDDNLQNAQNSNDPKEPITLVKDPETGEYRAKR